MARIIIPTPLRKFSQGERSFETGASTVLEALISLTDAYPQIKNHIYDTEGKLRSFIKIFVGEDDIKDLKNGETYVADKTVISIVPAIAGGKGE